MERQQAAEEKGRRMIREELRTSGWESAELGRRLKGDREKGRIARRLAKFGSNATGSVQPRARSS